MRMKKFLCIHLVGIALTVGVLADGASAHCDSMDGPVVQAARRALAIGNVAPALAWVRPQDEPEIRRAFERTQGVRAMGGGAVELAELWFFENLVRVHRAGEGEPYTGLKPSGTEVPPGIAAAERALEMGSVEDLHSWLAEDLARVLRDRFERVVATADHDPTDVDAGRRYVAAYSEFVHLAEELHQRMQSGAHAGHETSVAVSHDR